MAFRNDDLIERYEYDFFEPDTRLNTTVANDSRQVRSNSQKFVVENQGEITPFDWYKAKINLSFKGTQLDGGVIQVNDHAGIVNGSHSFINKLKELVNGVQVYDCNEANQCVNIKNLVEYTPEYVQTMGPSEFYYLDTSTSAEERTAKAT